MEFINIGAISIFGITKDNHFHVAVCVGVHRRVAFRSSQSIDPLQLKVCSKCFVEEVIVSSLPPPCLFSFFVCFLEDLRRHPVYVQQLWREEVECIPFPLT